MPRLLNKFILSFLASLVVLFSCGNFFVASAATAVSSNTTTSTSSTTSAPVGNWYNESFPEWYSKVYDNSNPSEIFGERYTAAQVQWVVYGLIATVMNAALSSIPGIISVTACIFANAANPSCFASLSQAPVTTNITRQPDPSLLSLVFADRPLSGISYTKNKIQNFSIIPVAHAASPSTGFGFDALQPIQVMWTATRDIAFGMFVIVAIVFAFMIMFRVKISPQVVISVQSAIPKLIIALILITFSYAIAGFLIDLMYVVIGIFSLILPHFIPTATYTPQQAFGILTGVPTTTNQQLSGIGIFIFTVGYLELFTITLIILIAQSTTAAGGLISFIIGIVIIMVGIIICFIDAIKTVWALVKAFANIILLVIFAPLQIIFGLVIPSLGFSSWIKAFVSNLAIFIGTGVMMFLSLIFAVQAFNKTDINLQGGTIQPGIVHAVLGPLQQFMPNFPQGASSITNKYWPPLLGNANGDVGTGFAYLMVSFVLFTLIPKMTEVIQGFMSGKPFAYGTAIGEALAPVKAGIQLGTQQYEGQQMKEFTKAFPNQKYPGEWWANFLRSSGTIR